jgi:hypothetical protein
LCPGSQSVNCMIAVDDKTQVAPDLGDERRMKIDGLDSMFAMHDAENLRLKSELHIANKNMSDVSNSMLNQSDQHVQADEILRMQIEKRNGEIAALLARLECITTSVELAEAREARLKLVVRQQYELINNNEELILKLQALTQTEREWPSLD